MTVREFPWLPPGGVVRWVRGMFVTLCAVLALLVHHELSHIPVVSASATAGAAPVATATGMAEHAMHHAAPMSAPHTPADSAGQNTLTGSPDGMACSSMVMQHCSSANVTAVQIAAPSESPIPAVPIQYATVAGVDIARSVSRAPPDLSVLSQLRI
ncbi:hypothetical protein ABZ192_18100 [Streptomyces sp. NPDC006235]|uniref:hypothetical protein n=1 Tax=Streptomyces sp. NPDC006235 TaxID=3156736 RepID=UPI0033BED4EE